MRIINLKSIAAVMLSLLLIFVITVQCRVVQAAQEYEKDGATLFKFTDRDINCTDGNYTDYEIDGTDLKITGSGTYVLSGSCVDGSVTVKKGTTGVVLVLNGLTLNGSDTAAISCNKSSGVEIVAATGTVNTLKDSEKNNDEAYPDNELAENAVLKCKDGSNVTVSGGGKIIIEALAKNGIKSGATTDEEGTASFTIRDASVSITNGVNDAINAEQELNIESGSLTVNAGDDAVHCDNTLNIGKNGGSGPEINIENCYEGLEGSIVNIYSGDININASDDGINAANSDLKGNNFEINVCGGNIYIIAQGDGLDSNGDLNITGGRIEIYSASSGADEPLDADGVVSLSGGTVLAAGAYGMGININAAVPYVMFGNSSSSFGSDGGNFDFGNIPDDFDPSVMQQPESFDPSVMRQPENFDPSTMRQTEGAPGERPESGRIQGEQNNNRGGKMTAGNERQASEAILIEGETFYIKDKNGSKIFESKAGKNATYVLLASGEMKDGEDYTLYSVSKEVGTCTAATGEKNDNRFSRTDFQNSSGKKSKFTDVKSDAWYSEAVDFVSGRNIMNGVDDNTFNPSGTVTRGMLATLVYRLEGSPEVTVSNSFSDVKSGAYYEKAVSWASAKGIVTGVDSSSFSPDSPVTREQMATILYRYAKYKGYDCEAGTANLKGFGDYSKISSYAVDAMSWAKEKGLITGVTDSTIDPKGSTTRSQAAVILQRFCEKNNVE